ncbi:DUF692 domain-containing protein [Vibrio mimicus]|uniref:DUF692 domain-containing protein n=1 Tax=Vibrio mimicus TaxID=674 RepID=UPI00076B844F|nr:DUF692 domain-containing protein [Vibrio mimicus]AMG05195.1 DUF692 domain-containing protein [Vibrio mimicus]KAA3494096.1 DUF692 domain-containing protein [Vibrio mimicus]
MRAIAHTSKGIGLRSEHVDVLCQLSEHPDIDFLELAPENWMNMGGLKREQLQQIAKHYPLIAHGLSLSIGDCQPLNKAFVKKVAAFLDEFNIDIYSEHLSFSRDAQGYLYELLPIPRYKESIAYLVDRIHCVQDIVQRPLVLENISYYHSYGKEIPEGEFIAEIVERSGCQLLIDINNVYVNSRNHSYCPFDMLATLPSEAICYYHIAGHLKEREDFLLDTHGKPVQQEVIDLARYAYAQQGSRPLLLERDHHVPPLVVLTEELRTIHHDIMQPAPSLVIDVERSHA